MTPWMDAEIDTIASPQTSQDNFQSTSASAVDNRMFDSLCQVSSPAAEQASHATINHDVLLLPTANCPSGTALAVHILQQPSMCRALHLPELRTWLLLQLCTHQVYIHLSLSSHPHHIDDLC
jgi:hypothetical protein